MRKIKLFLYGCIAISLAGMATGGGAEEIAPPESLPCFPGAYYRKAVSSMDHWTGIEGIVTLPRPTLDNARRKPSGRHLDNPSIYMGGRCGEQEIDAGLTWEVIREPDGSVSAVGKAFRPFWRNDGWHSAPAKPEYYYYPGDTVRMSCVATGENTLRISVDLLARAKPGDDAATATLRQDKSAERLHVKNLERIKPISSFSAEFEAPGFGPDALQQFKRVNAIDQSGNEGKGVSPTHARVVGAVWRGVWLLRGKERLPMTPKRFTDMRCPAPRYFVVEPAGDPGEGGERISIYGDPAMKP